jgi:hypothetical protein
MSRVKLEKGQQSKFLNRIAKYFDFDWSKIAKISNICERTLRDWRREKYNMKYEALLKLHNIANVSIPKVIKILPEYWSAKKFARLGALRRNELYGSPGTPEGRKKGGLTTARKFREDPEFAKMIGFKLRLPFSLPPLSTKFSEFIGIMLGDGHIKSNRFQLGISFNTLTDNTYAEYIQRLIKELFNLNFSISYENDGIGATIVVSNRNLIEFLIKKGLKTGDKVVNQVDIPNWINLKKEYKIACLRGLIDTGGSFYLYKHKVFKKLYYNFAMCFTNHSLPLLKSTYKILKAMGFSPVISRFRIYLHKKDETDRYFKEIGTNNPKHLAKFNNYLKFRRNA